jgi:hypothetical protein
MKGFVICAKSYYIQQREQMYLLGYNDLHRDDPLLSSVGIIILRIIFSTNFNNE